MGWRVNGVKVSMCYWISRRKKRIYSLVYFVVVALFFIFSKYLMIVNDKQEKELDRQLSHLNRLNISIELDQHESLFKSSVMRKWQALDIDKQSDKKPITSDLVKKKIELNIKSMTSARIIIKKHEKMEPSE